VIVEGEVLVRAEFRLCELEGDYLLKQKPRSTGGWATRARPGVSAMWPQCWLCAVCAVCHAGCCVRVGWGGGGDPGGGRRIILGPGAGGGGGGGVVG